MLLENASSKYTPELNTHSIEIVLSDNNLNNIILNPKTNYSWIVVPEEIGLLKILSEGEIHVVKPTKLNNETSKLDILQAFIVKNI